LPQWEQDETPVPVHQEGSEQWSKSKEHPHLLLTSVPTARGCCEQSQLDGGAQEERVLRAQASCSYIFLRQYNNGMALVLEWCE